MIKSVTVVNYLGNSLKLDLDDPWSTGLAITKMEGLGPAKASINFSSVATMDGDLFNSARVESRNIVISLQYLWHPDIETTRQLTYKYFPVKRPLTLIIEADNRTVSTVGYVESNEPDIFSDNESAKISIMCPNAYFLSAGNKAEQEIVFSSTEPTFEFIWEDPNPGTPTLIFGNIELGKEQLIFYEGDAEVGVTISIGAVGPATNIKILNTLTRQTMSINTDFIKTLTGSSLVNGDEIIIHTQSGQKSVLLLRSGKYYNILNALDKDTAWFTLSKGDNIFAYTAESGATNLNITIKNKILYEGV